MSALDAGCWMLDAASIVAPHHRVTEAQSHRTSQTRRHEGTRTTRSHRIYLSGPRGALMLLDFVEARSRIDNATMLSGGAWHPDSHESDTGFAARPHESACLASSREGRWENRVEKRASELDSLIAVGRECPP